MDSTNFKFDLTVPFSRETFDNKNLNADLSNAFPIRSNTILYKHKTGLGATFNEIVSERHSIIVLPNVAIVKSKHEYHANVLNHDTFAVYGGITNIDIQQYLLAKPGYKKILTTPHGLCKVISALKPTRVHAKDIFFLLIDECHKIIKDANYRSDLLKMMEHFFEFKDKAMVSATPLPPTDPRFAEQGFKHIKLQADFYNKIKIRLVHTNSLVKSFKDYIANKPAEHYCIFFNSITGIKSLIEELNLQAKSKIFCSEESVDLLALNDSKLNVSTTLSNYQQFNFFTSSFFNGLDINLTSKPEIIILTDYGYQHHTILDPYTDILQIIGRTRLKEQDAIHINNWSSRTVPLTLDEANSKIEFSKHAYELICNCRSSAPNKEVRNILKQTLTTVSPYFNLLDENEHFSYFLKDNYLHHNRVKGYYQRPSDLKAAYFNTGLFEIEEDRSYYEKDQIERLKVESVRSSSSMNKKIAHKLKDLEDYRGLREYNTEVSLIKQMFPLMHQAYCRLGYDVLEMLKFQKSKIVKEIIIADFQDSKNHFPLRDRIYQTFSLDHRYHCPDVKNKLQIIYNEFGINRKAVAKHIEDYFEFDHINDYRNGKSNRAYIFTNRKHNPLSLV